MNYKVLFFLFLSASLLGQSSEDLRVRCGSTDALSNYYKTYPEGQIIDQRVIKTMDKSILSNRNIAKQYVIPVVFHVYQNNKERTVPLAQIQSALDRTNNEFRGLNNDFDFVHPSFLDRRGTIDVTLALATIDPEGKPTSGVKYYNTLSGFGKNDGTTNNKIASYAWDNYKYLNIYIMYDLYGNGVTNNSGVAWLPSVNMSDRGIARIVYNYRYLGNTGSSIADDNFQSVFTHEVGHWLDLNHTFYNGCSGPGDSIDDTPPTENIDGCSPNGVSCGNLVNEENYMDYSKCYSMFTKGQVERMQNALELHPARKSIWQLDNLKATGTMHHYVQIVPTAKFTVTDTVIEEGQTIFFTDLSIGEPEVWEWTIPGGDPLVSNEQHPSSTFHETGVYRVSFVSSNSKGQSSPYHMDIKVVEKERICEILYDFEQDSLNDESPGWTSNELAEGQSWVVSKEVQHPEKEVGNFTSRAYRSFQSLISNGNWVNGVPITKQLISPAIDLTGIVEPKLSYFDMRGWDLHWPVNKPKHTIEILISKDEAGPWELLAMDTAHTSQFQTWREIKNIDLSNFTDEVVYISFRTKTHHYYWRLDDICISGTEVSTKSEELEDVSVFLYPNPAKNVLNVYSPSQLNYGIKLVDLTGKVILDGHSMNNIDLSEVRSGMYFVELIELKSRKRIIKSLVVLK